MKISSLPKLLVIWASTPSTSVAFFYPNPQTSLLEHILVDTHGSHRSTFTDAITPCKNYINGPQTLGRETAAQWLRVAFHDFVTANITAGTGGLDASIGFETLRTEDSGSAFNDSLSFFRPFVNSEISMSDLIAMATVVSVGNCGGPRIPVRGGRIDAGEEGPFGVPAPDTDLETTLGYFSGAGFNQTDAIALTACGHTMGSVHHAGFPTVVGPSAVTANNTGGVIHLDSTPSVFDTDVVHEYVTGTGQQGGPLVTSFNISSRSDLRLYESDSNATMRNLDSQSATELFGTCAGLLQRMIETVPAIVNLSEIIAPQVMKPVNTSLDILDGGVVYSGSIRLLTNTSSPASISLWMNGIDYSNTQHIIQIDSKSAGSSIFGTTSYYPFSIPLNISNPTSFTSVTISTTTQSKTFPIQANAFIVPSQSSANTSNTNSTVVNVTIAISKTSSQDDRQVLMKAPVAQQGTWAPTVKKWTVSMAREGDVVGYELWVGNRTIENEVTGAVSLQIFSGSVLVDMVLLD